MLPRRYLRALLRRVFFRSSVTDEIDEEMAFHIQARVEELRQRGVTDRDARQVAMTEFGNVRRLQDEAYDLRGMGIVETVRLDLRDVVRGWRRSKAPLLVAFTVLSLAVGITTAVYSMVDAVLLRSLPFSDPSRLVAILGAGGNTAFMRAATLTTPQTFLDWRDAQHSFESVSLVGTTVFRAMSPSDQPVNLNANQVSSDFFRVFRISPALGRVLQSGDEQEAQSRVVVLSDHFWHQHYGGERDVIGKFIALNEQQWQVVGVLPPSFSYPVVEQPGDIFVPFPLGPAQRVRGRGHNYNGIVIGRLAPDVDIAQASREFHVLTERLDEQFPTWEPQRRARLVDLKAMLVGDVRRWIVMLFAAVSFVLLIACLNVSNLMLLRAVVNRREQVLRAVLGASSARLFRTAVAEGVFLSAAAGVSGAAIAYGTVSALRYWLPANIPRADGIAVDARVLAVECLLVILVGVGLGCVSFWHGRSAEDFSVLKNGGRGSSRARGLLGRTVVVAEVALASILVVGAGLFTMSFARLMKVDLGFNYTNVLAARIGLTFAPPGVPAGTWSWTVGDGPGHRDQQMLEYVAQAEKAVRHIPGAMDVALVDGGLPLQGGWSNRSANLPGHPDERDSVGLDRVRITPNYFSLMGIPLRRGRAFVAADREGGTNVAVMNESAARLLWPDVNPIGQRLVVEERERTVIGVVGDTRHLGPEEPVRPAVYVPLGDQGPLSGALDMIVRSSGDAHALLAPIKAAVWSVKPDQYFPQKRFVLGDYLDGLIAQRRFSMGLIAALGLIGMVIAFIGLYGALAFDVAARTQEIGIRAALGATPLASLLVVLKSSMALVGLGLALAAGLWLSVSSTLAQFLFQTTPSDRYVLIVATGLVVLSGLVAGLVPGARAAATDPIVALRNEQ